jgi:hypothetical protein
MADLFEDDPITEPLTYPGRIPDTSGVLIDASSYSLRAVTGTEPAPVLRRLPAPAGSESAGLILNPLSFGAGRRHQDRSYWVWPLPPAGPLAFVCEWAAFDIPEARAGTEAQPILDAAQRTVQLWPAGNS